MNRESTRANLVTKVVPFDGEVVGPRSRRANRVSGNGKTCCIVFMDNRLKLFCEDGARRASKAGTLVWDEKVFGDFIKEMTKRKEGMCAHG